VAPKEKKMSSNEINSQMSTEQGFIAALDRSGGSTPGDLLLVGANSAMALRRSGRYEHHGSASSSSQPVRDIEVATVPEELSGALSLPHHPGCDVISESRLCTDSLKSQGLIAQEV
jgi:hypothetical protein